MPPVSDTYSMILDHVARALILADDAGMIDVGISLNQALVALGHPGVALPSSNPYPIRDTTPLTH